MSSDHGTMIQLRHLTAEMVRVAEKASLIARAIRSEDLLFDLLVQEKTGSAKNDRFDTDFKTLADVLIQEMVKHELGSKFAGLSAHIYGEESNVFENTLGQSVTVQVGDSETVTKEILCTILDDNEKAASLLAQIVHSKVSMATDTKLDGVTVSVDVNDIGVWIDPIDSTFQYIHGHDANTDDDDHPCQPPYQRGLQCVTVLIGAYHRTSGRPITGVAHQPFCVWHPDNACWTGRYVWGISYNGVNAYTSIPTHPPTHSHDPTPIVIYSSCDATIQTLPRSSFRLFTSAGAGYKALCVIDGFADVYASSMHSTFKWDTCATHAILLARGGGFLCYGTALETLKKRDDPDIDSLLAQCQLCYHKPDFTESPASKKWSNSRGIIAYREITTVKDILRTLI